MPLPPLQITTEIMVPSILQVVVALGLLNVWLLRSHKQTGYRGGSSSSLKEEFSAYGLPFWAFYFVGLLKIGSALMLLAGIWFPATVEPATITVSGLMIGAIAMHIKVRDPLVRSAPAIAMLVMCALILALKSTG
ncbi:MAG: hypothetical protein ACI8QC_003674 [Planctomycetota bacterium]|jgi:hypothetical protein